ncbi:MAG: transporter [Gemmatimonadota bacterium]
MVLLSRRSSATLALAMLWLMARPASGVSQERIEDNSFLVEEAYDQERGVVQHINTFSRSAGDSWLYTFTQEWPLFGRRNQLSYTIPIARSGSAAGNKAGLGDIALNYRYQLVGLNGGPVAISPRLTLLLPTGDETTGHGAGGAGLNAALPLSVLLAPQFVAHFNAGLTVTPRAKNVVGERARTRGYNLGGSVIFLAAPSLNLMVEAVWLSSEEVLGVKTTSRREQYFVSPGVRYAVTTRGGLQIVPGVAYTVGIGPSRDDNSLFFYLSLEHRFRSAR